MTSQLFHPILTSLEIQSLRSSLFWFSRSLRWTAVLTKCQRRSSASSRTKRALKAAAGHLSFKSDISAVSDHLLWRLTHSPLFTVTDHWPMIWLALMGNHCICDWKRQWTLNSLRWGDSALHSFCISELRQHLLMKKSDVGRNWRDDVLAV